MQSLPGFRDFYPEDFAFRRYIVETWRRVARSHGFREYDAPTLESTALYEKKNSGGEILGQLYQFTDRGERQVALRPEMTPSLARMVAARATHYRKPIKWFSIANFFRFERQQKGRLREFMQFNADLLGDASPGADAELMALTIDILRAFGLGPQDVALRLSDRGVWLGFLDRHGISRDRAADFLGIIDKMEREPAEVTGEKLQAFGLELAQVQEFIAGGGEEALAPLLADLRTRGLGDFLEVDLTIVRGLAYYTGAVFEVFDRSRQFRAIAGGGRYDHLIRHLSDGGADLPAIGVGIGDVVLGKLIESNERAFAQSKAVLAADPDCEIFVVVADESRRPQALSLVSQLRDEGRRVDFSISALKVGKQFAAAEAAGATHAIVVGTEWPDVRLKVLETREEFTVPAAQVGEKIGSTAQRADLQKMPSAGTAAR
jgi:histidyl-tRNA synthetase